MQRRKKEVYIAVSVCVIAIILGGGIAFYKHQQKVQAEELRLEMERKRIAEEKRKEKLEKELEQKLEEDSREAVNQLFADEEKNFLSDTYKSEDLEHAQNIVNRIKNEKVKNEWNEILKKADDFQKQVEDSKQKTLALFTSEEKSALAEQVTREMIDTVKQQVEEHTPQKIVQESLRKDIELAYQYIQQREEQVKEQQLKEQQLKEAEQAAQRQKEENENSNSSSDNADRNGNSNMSNNSSNSNTNTNSNSNTTTNNNTNSNSNDNQPIVAKMKLANQTNQIVTVVAGGSSATVTFWQKSAAGWQQIFSTNGQVGAQGVGPADEYHSYTPRGAYSLGFAFGTNNPGTSLNFRQITNRSYWISNVDDPDYNTWQERDSSSSVDEHLASYASAYQYAVVINYNTACVRGGGSAFFFHCGNGRATAGCVAIPTNYMRQALQQLQSGAFIVNVRSEQELLNY